jgi:GT2 family glycosyltransferase
MSEKLIRVEIVAPVHNRKAITLQCLKSLSRLNRDGLDVHIVIVDDGSTDGTFESIEREFPEVELIKGDGNLWFTEGTNVGVRAALKHNPKYVLMINDDSVFDAEFLLYLVKTAEENPRSVVGPLLILWDMPHKLFQTAPVWDAWSGGWRHWTHQTVWTTPKTPWSVDLIVGNCVLVPAAAIEEAGLMNAGRYPNFGDAEYTPRLRKKGWQLLIDPRARVFCQPNALPPPLKKLGLKKMMSALIFDLKNIHNLRRRFYSNIDGAPSRRQGILAFTVFFFRLLARKNAESVWAEKQTEQPLSAIYADRLVSIENKTQNN